MSKLAKQKNEPYRERKASTIIIVLYTYQILIGYRNFFIERDDFMQTCLYVYVFGR